MFFGRMLLLAHFCLYGRFYRFCSQFIFDRTASYNQFILHLMSTLPKVFHTLAVIFSYILLSILLISCSSSDEAVDKNKYYHPHDATIDMEKHLFEHVFAQQCVSKESAKLVNREVGREGIAESCMCIAKYLFKDLAAKDSYAFLNDKKHAQSLRNKYEEAANQCL